jgi:cell division protein FtsI/penicillin-binding protein 2
MLVLLVGAFGIVARLIQIQVVDRDHYKAEAREEHEQTTVVRAARGAILDRNGYPLATTMKTFDLYIDPRIWADDLDALRGAAIIGPLLGREPAELVVAVRQQLDGSFLAARQVDASIGAEVLKQAPPGVQAVETSSRFRPEGDLAASLLGFTGLDGTGLAGIEADFDRELGGVPGVVYVERDGRGQPIPFGRKVGTKPEPGGDVKLTIDRYIQGLVETELDETVKKNGAIGATISVMDPLTGELLAMASRPS